MPSTTGRTLLRFLAVLSLSLGSLLILVSLYLFARYISTVPELPCTPTRNALWAQHKWVGEPHTSNEYQDFASQLRLNGITDVFFHVGPLNESGSIEHSKYPYAGELISNLKERNPALGAQAWIGQIELRGGGPLDLSSSSTRNNIVRIASSLLDLGFDGIHYDIEPIPAGDPDFLDLLAQTRKVTAQRSKVLSIASSKLQPAPILGDLARITGIQAGLWHVLQSGVENGGSDGRDEL